MIVRLGKNSFPFSNTLKDKVRREHYFKDGSGELMPEEQAILDAIHVDDRLRGMLRPYLAEFFEKLPQCQTDTSLVLSKECQVPHHVVWSAFFDSHARAKDVLLNNRKQFQPRMDIEDAVNTAIIADMKEKIDPDADINALFTLIFESPRASERTGDPIINRLFTLLLRSDA